MSDANNAWPTVPMQGSLAWEDYSAGRPPRQGGPDGSPQAVFTRQLHAALDRLGRLDWTGLAGDDGGHRADLALDRASAALDGPDPEAHLAHALEALRRWERAWIAVAPARGVAL
jgi:hypothetical protein